MCVSLYETISLVCLRRGGDRLSKPCAQQMDPSEFSQQIFREVE